MTRRGALAAVVREMALWIVDQLDVCAPASRYVLRAGVADQANVRQKKERVVGGRVSGTDGPMGGVGAGWVNMEWNAE